MGRHAGRVPQSALIGIGLAVGLSVKWNFCFAPIVLKNSFWEVGRNFSKPLVRGSKKEPGAYLPKHQLNGRLPLILHDGINRPGTPEKCFASILTGTTFRSFSTLSARSSPSPRTGKQTVNLSYWEALA